MRGLIRAFDSPCAAAVFPAELPLFALEDGTIRSLDSVESGQRAHSALVASATDRDALLTAGEEGNVCRASGAGVPQQIASLPRKLIACLTPLPDGGLAWATGRSVWLSSETNGSRERRDPRELQSPRSVSAIACSPDGQRLAIASYDGVSVLPLHEDLAPLRLDWRGQYRRLAFSPDGRFLVAGMQDALLHGWQLEEQGKKGEPRHFRMTGYASRPEDWSWSADGRWLATSGAPFAVLWPFDGETGPMGQDASELGTPRGEALVSAVACHPGTSEIALGYDDGAVLLADADSGAERLLLEPDGSAVRALAWHAHGRALAFGCASGRCGMLGVESNSAPNTVQAQAWTRP